MRSMQIIPAICALSLCVCGTFSDAVCGPISDHVYYRGVRFDIQAAKEGGPKRRMAADLPLSAVADTLMVPYLAYHELTDPQSRDLPSVTEVGTKTDQRTVDFPSQSLKD